MADSSNYKLPSSRAEAVKTNDREADKYRGWRSSVDFKDRLNFYIDEIRHSIQHCVDTQDGPCIVRRSIYSNDMDIVYSMPICQEVLDKIKQHNPTYDGSCDKPRYGGRDTILTINPHF